MKIILSPENNPRSINPIFAFFAVIIIFLGFNLIMNFIRPLTNLYIIYIELDWAQFQFLELYDIFNMIFGSALIIYAFLILHYQSINKILLIFGGFLFFLYNFIDPTHYLVFGSLILVLSGAPPAWISLIPDNLLGIYLFSWGILSFSHLLLQIVGFYVAVRIARNSNPKRALIQFLILYCWVALVSGIILWAQSFIILSITSSWSSLASVSYIFRLGTWISMSILGITGLLYIYFWRKEQLKRQHVKFAQIALISFALMTLFISFSDIAMKTSISLVLNSLVAGILIYLSLKLPKYLEIEPIKEEITPSMNHLDQI